MANPSSSGTGYMVLLSLVNAWGEQQALDYFDQLSANVLSFTSSGSGPVNSLILGETAIGIGMTSQAVTKINEGYPLEIMFFEEGSPYSMYGQTIIEGKQERACVREVFEFLTTTFSEEIYANFYPEKVLKDKEFTVKNYPTDIKYADMQVENASAYKDYLLSKWKH
jgi:iron(III) transport system substrate-binding protein